MDVAIRIAVHLGLVVWVIVVHELGHYVAGRAAGVPGARMRIVLHRYPFHVALDDAGTWRSPVDGSRYAGVMQELIGTTGGLLLFIVGGLVMQTIGAAGVALVLRIAGLAGLGWFTLAFSAGMVFFYLAIEGVGALVPAMPPGDVRGMLSISPVGGAATLVAVVAAHAVLLLVW